MTVVCNTCSIIQPSESRRRMCSSEPKQPDILTFKTRAVQKTKCPSNLVYNLPLHKMLVLSVLLSLDHFYAKRLLQLHSSWRVHRSATSIFSPPEASAAIYFPYLTFSRVNSQSKFVVGVFKAKDGWLIVQWFRFKFIAPHFSGLTQHHGECQINPFCRQTKQLKNSCEARP